MVLHKVARHVMLKPFVVQHVSNVHNLDCQRSHHLDWRDGGEAGIRCEALREAGWSRYLDVEVSVSG